jgi:hypothetical protein
VDEPMTAKVVLCVFTGHRWREAADVHETFPVLSCRRCGRLRKLAAGTRPPEGWAERAGRRTRAGEFVDAGIQRRD